VGDGSHIHDPGWGAFLPQIEKQVGEQEGSQIIHDKGGLQTILGKLSFWLKGPCIIDHNMQTIMFLLDLPCHLAHLGLRGEIGNEQHQAVILGERSDLLQHSLPVLPIAVVQ
jgi:hypothetical protein